MVPPPQRAGRLAKFFHQVIDGKRALATVDNVKLFVEAVLAQDNHSACVERIIASPEAQSAIHNGFRFDVSPTFINQTTAPFIQYLSHPAVKQLCNGQFLQELLKIIAEPRTLWSAFMRAFEMWQLNEHSIHAFAWMLFELLSLPPSSQIDLTDDAKKVVNNGSLVQSSSTDIRALGYKIEHILRVRTSRAPVDPEFAPGGRHDNDFAEFWKIAIYPTADEFTSTTRPFYRRSDEISNMPAETRIAAHLDNQFRLLREDMVSELRDDIQIARGQKKGRRSVPLLQELTLRGTRCTDGNRLKPFALSLACQKGLEPLYAFSSTDRKTYLRENRHFLKHQAFGCLIRGGDIIAFGTIERDVDRLLLNPPEIVVRILGEASLKKALLSFKLYKDVRFLMVDAPVFAYEPILRCLQDKTDLALTKNLLEYARGDAATPSNLMPTSVLDQLEAAGSTNIQHILKTQTPVHLDPSQLESFSSGLNQSVSLIQGPPGTGKSFVGALLTNAFHEYTEETILVMCYTNHALDQFLEDLLDIGIDASSIVRLGSKSSQRTSSLSLSEQRISYRRTQSSWNVINTSRSEADYQKEKLNKAFDTYQKFAVSIAAILDFLEFEDPVFHDAFIPPDQDDGMVMVGEHGKTVDSHYLFDIWSQGKHPGPLVNELPEESKRVWDIEREARKSLIQGWTRILLEEHIVNTQTLAQQFDRVQDRIEKVWNEKTLAVLKTKRIIGCTTTGAAMYAQDLRQAGAGIVLLEEAGEILESHVLTAMGSETKQLVLIGDHQQLRPKINSYALSVEKGEGYNLNRSLFERLVLAGYPHMTLAKQHRMCPEISSLVKRLTYPDLLDDPKTLSRPAQRGLQDRVIFLDHRHLEARFMEVSDRRDEGTKGSKRNIFEVEMVLKIVKYLGQQGYGTDKLVVLTPYLGQLHLLRDYLRKDTDPVLNDLDSYDLVRAGLLSQAGAQYKKRPIRLSTIDNYQGEESDIVIVSLTRSNDTGDIGFMAAPQRLNVLLSRARDVLIMVGNSKTFTSNRNGKEVWAPFMENLNANHHLYDGLPVKCERHPQRKAILRTKGDFDTECPDGGCPLPCGVKLSCGLHDCPYKCHQLSDHSKMVCYKIVEWACPRGHQITQSCFQHGGLCRTCDAEDEAKEKRRQRDLKLDAERERRQEEYTQTLAELQDKIDHERRLQKDEYESEQRQKVLDQHRTELTNLRSKPKSPVNGTGHTSGGLSGATSQASPKFSSNQGPNRTTSKNINGGTKTSLSSAEADWDYQKQFERAQSSELDTLMAMIGLENVKKKFLSIKAQVDAALRQNVDLKGERFGTVLTGNPGTGKTTVARLYAKFLSSVGVLPGSTFEESTGSRLANGGVSGCETVINKILNSGGGVLFIDEAYQLTEGNSNGLQVVDYLLGEVENLTGKLVVVLAGYRSRMEKFFGHNPGIPSRFPHELRFDDYNDDELRQILKYRITRKYRGRMKAEDGMDGLYSRIVARRIGRGRGKEGFANARAVEIICARISERQANRIALERRRSQTMVDDMLLTKEDLIGPEPSQALDDCEAWTKLQEMIGLQSVKDTLRALLDSIQYNYQHELEEKPIVDFTLNRVFLGSPGTGKTSVAKLYGQILVDIGMLSNGEVVVKNPADFVGAVLGESEKNTKGILAATAGKVLVIDEAYGLFGGGSRDGTGAKTNQFKTAVVDAIVSEVQSTPGDDRCVLLLGYQDQMEEMFQNVNPGLQRRFPLDSAFAFEDFTDDELGQILDFKLKQQGFGASPRGRKAAMDVLSRARNRPHFGNAGEIDILLNEAKFRHQKRLSAEKKSSGKVLTDASKFEPQDFDEDYDRGERTETNIPKLFAGVMGSEQIVQQLEGYRLTVRNMRKLDMDPREQIPFNFLFRGPPGTGKTSTARKMGKIYYDMGFLSSAEVIESSATDLIGQYIGHTGPRTQGHLEKGLGKVLLIDEAYRLAEGHFAKEAIDEIIDCVTKPKFKQKLIIILAGYDNDINQLMATNPGLTSRFPESVTFNGMDPNTCVKLLTSQMQSRKHKLSKKQTTFNIDALEKPRSAFHKDLEGQFLRLSRIPNWANARDVETLAQAIFRRAISSITNGPIVLDESNVFGETDRMITERTHRQTASINNKNTASSQNHDPALATQSSNCHSHQSVANTGSHGQQPDENARKPDEVSGISVEAKETRDPGVTDAVWSQLEKDKAADAAREKQYQMLVEDENATKKVVEDTRKKELYAANQGTSNQKSHDDEARRRHEQERLKHELERRAREEQLDKLRKKREEEQKRRKQEQEAQKKLKQMGVCCMGFRWIKQKQAAGYRCAGGSHFVSDAQLGM